MNKTDKAKIAFLVGISAIAIILLLFVDMKSGKTSQDQYANYFVSVTEKSVNLTRAFQNEIGLWQLGQISNVTMAEVTDNYLKNFTSQISDFNETESPEIFRSAKENLLNSFANEIKSYEFFRDYLLTGNVTKNDISTDFLSQALEDEALSFKIYQRIINETNS